MTTAIVVLVASATAASATPNTARTVAGTTPGTVTMKFSLNSRDTAALRDLQKASKLRHAAEEQRNRIAALEMRITMVQGLLDEAAGEEARLRSALETHLIEQYKSGGSVADWTFIAQSESIADVVDRSQITRASQDQVAGIAQARSMTLQRMEDLQIALENLRDLANERAAHIEDHADLLDHHVEAARSAHMEAATTLTGEPAVAGTWMVMDPNAPDFSALAGTFSGGLGGAYSGGTITPHEAPTVEQIQRVLRDPRIQIYAGGMSDIQAGRIDGRVLDALSMLANQFGQLSVTSLISGHGVYTSSGNISEHTYGCAADIGTLQSIVIQPSSQGPHSITEQGVRFLAALQGRLAPHQVISLYSYGGPTLGMADHDDHIHLGYHC